ncbi:hypothetical protein [Streptomyces sp. NPDC020667]|uniref:class II glutamine amidotransferase n=1 Tax=Streptomyces sp. NPDC020667 TaxID=3154895 RepID=UPI0033E89C23
MCGLFGFIRNEACGDPSRASVMCFQLGALAEERGTDAAGLAMATGATATVASPVVSRRDMHAGGWRVVKGAGPFRKIWDPKLTDVLDRAPAVLGHTRWATQGDTRRLANSSPLQVGQLIGTHNGDVDALDLQSAYELPDPTGQTDTEVLMQALDQAGGVIAATLQVLESALGRAALAWTDRRWPNLVMLARTAVSPLAVAVDDDGNLFWASNPGWFPVAARRSGVRIQRERIWLMPEGTLLLVDYSTGAPLLAGRHRFTATARTRDDRLAPIVAYRGFSKGDRAADQKLINHRTLPDPVRLRRTAPLWA